MFCIDSTPNRPRRRTSAWLPIVVVLAAAGCLLASPAGALVPRDDPSGALLYQRECAPCHGPTGRGDGPQGMYFAPPPRDLHDGFLALYPNGELIEKIRRGRPLRIDVDPRAMRERTQMVEQIVAHMNRLPDVNWEAVERGAEIYSARCEACHGPFGRPVPAVVLPPGLQKPPRDLSSPAFQKSMGDRELMQVVRHGRDGMPAIPPLASEAEAKDLIAFVRLLSPGFAYYSLWCGGCHGDDGSGDGVFATGADRPKVVFDRAYLAAQDPEQLRRNVVHMLERQDPAMPHFERDLSPAQAQGIIDFLRGSGAGPTAKPSAVP